MAEGFFESMERIFIKGRMVKEIQGSFAWSAAWQFFRNNRCQRCWSNCCWMERRENGEWIGQGEAAAK